MKRILATAILVLGVVSLATAAGAASYAGVALNLQPQCSAGSIQTPQIGWMTNDGTGHATTDGYDNGWDVQDTIPMIFGGMVEMDVVNAVIAPDRVQYDFRAPIVAASNYQIWRLKSTIPNNPDEVGTTISLQAWFVPGYLPAGVQFFCILDGDYRTQADCLAAAAGTALIYKLTPANAAAGYTSGTTTWSIPAPVYDAENDSWSTPARYFTVYAALVPEPGSMLALLSGLVGLVGFRVRRRR